MYNVHNQLIKIVINIINQLVKKVINCEIITLTHMHLCKLHIYVGMYIQLYTNMRVAVHSKMKTLKNEVHKRKGGRGDNSGI